MREWHSSCDGGLAGGRTEAVVGNNRRLSKAKCDIHRGLIVLWDDAGGFKATHLGSSPQISGSTSVLVH